MHIYKLLNPFNINNNIISTLNELQYSNLHKATYYNYNNYFYVYDFNCKQIINKIVENKDFLKEIYKYDTLLKDTKIDNNKMYKLYKQIEYI